MAGRPAVGGIVQQQLIVTAGLWYFAACLLQFVAVFVEQAGAARSPEEEGERRTAAGLMLTLASLLTPGLLLLHGFFLTVGADAAVRVGILAAPIAALLLGALLGAMLGAAARGVAPAMRKAVLPLGLMALAITLYATSPSLVALANSLRDGMLELPVRPV